MDTRPTADDNINNTSTGVRPSSLKSSYPTKWNSTLHLVSLILQLKDVVQNLLKRIGHAELCLHIDEIDFLNELLLFLKPLEYFTDLFSLSAPSLSIIPLMKTRIKKNCTINSSDSDIMKAIKTAIVSKVDVRFPESDSMKLYQILDAGTKSFVPKHEATALLERAFKQARNR